MLILGELIDSQLREDLQCWSLGWWGVYQQPTQVWSTANSERICSVDPWGLNWQPTQVGSAANSERICSVDPWGGWLTANSGRICSQLREDLQCWSWGEGVDWQPTQIGSAANSERICTVLGWAGGGARLTVQLESLETHSELAADLLRVGCQSTPPINTADPLWVASGSYLSWLSINPPRINTADPLWVGYGSYLGWINRINMERLNSELLYREFNHFNLCFLHLGFKLVYNT